ncbi:MAG: DMT family transporter [Deltaproteobacteria bacterium]|nr:DMT family transporter [Deltaproteobacteria bacterium]
MTTTTDPLQTTTPTTRQTLVGSSFLLGAAFFWGFGFYAQRVSVEDITPLWAVALRFALAVPLALAGLAWRRSAGVRIPWRTGAVLGVLLYVIFAFQTVALIHTPVTRVALITGLYAVFVPLLQPAFKLPRPGPLQLLAVFVALVGLVLLCGVVGDDRALSVPPNIGDLYTLFMAVISAVMVLLIGRAAQRDDPVALNVVQILVMAAVAVVVAPLIEGAPPTTLSERAITSLVYLAVASTFLAFLFQMLGQRHVSPSTASVLMLLETPIGVLAAVAILHERMAGFQWVGAGLALVAVVVAVVAERRSG